MKKIKTGPLKATDAPDNLKTMTYQELINRFTRIVFNCVGKGFKPDCKNSVLATIEAEAKRRPEFKPKDFDAKKIESEGPASAVPNAVP